MSQHDWPLANASGRTRVFEEHKWWTRALLFFLAHDAAVQRMQPAFSAEMRSWGLCKDEFPETDHWPPQLCESLTCAPQLRRKADWTLAGT